MFSLTSLRVNWCSGRTGEPYYYKRKVTQRRGGFSSALCKKCKIPHTNCIFIKITRMSYSLGKLEEKDKEADQDSSPVNWLSSSFIWMITSFLEVLTQTHDYLGLFQVHSWMCSQTQVSIFTFCSVHKKGKEGKTDQEQNLVSSFYPAFSRFCWSPPLLSIHSLGGLGRRRLESRSVADSSPVR